MRPSKAPSATAYAGYVEMALAIEAELTKEGLEPRDLLDIHDFIWVTLRPASLEILEKIRAEAAASSDADAESDSDAAND